MDELEKTVNDLLKRLKDRESIGSGLNKTSPDDGGNNADTGNQEVAELVRRTIKRLKSL